MCLFVPLFLPLSLLLNFFFFLPHCSLLSFFTPHRVAQRKWPCQISQNDLFQATWEYDARRNTHTLQSRINREIGGNKKRRGNKERRELFAICGWSKAMRGGCRHLVWMQKVDRRRTHLYQQQMPLKKVECPTF